MTRVLATLRADTSAGGVLVSLLACFLATAGPADAQEYRPVSCAARQTYQGRPLRSAVEPLVDGTLPIDALPAATAAGLDRTFDAMRNAAKADVLNVAVGRLGEGVWSRTSAGGKRLWWASAGKSFVAVVVLQLVEEGKLSLGDAVSRWIKQIPNGDAVTVRDLLAHTSGLFSANEDRRVRARPRYLSLDETVTILQRHGAMFCPGANWRYSNSGYDLLGAIVEAVDRRSLQEAIEARIVGRLGLSTIVTLRPGHPAPDVAKPVSAREVPTDLSTIGAAGPIAGDAADMVRFWSALLSGRLLRPATVSAQFQLLYPMFDPGTYYGLGVMVLEVDDGGRHDVWLGHAGGGPGASAMLAYSPADRAFVAVALTGDGPAAAVANGVLKSLRTLPPGADAVPQVR